MKKLIEKVQSDTTTLWLFVIASFLLGIVIGIFCAPVKKGLTIASNNTLIGGDDDDDKKKSDDEWDDDYDEDEAVEF